MFVVFPVEINYTHGKVISDGADTQMNMLSVIL